MNKLVDIPELEAAIKNEKFGNIKILHQILFENLGDRKNRQRIREFSGFSFQVDSPEFKTKIEKIKTDFQINELITVANVLSIDNSGSLDDLTARVVSSLCDLNVLKNSIILDDSDIDDENSEENGTENRDNLTNESNTTPKEMCDSTRNDSGSRKNQIQQLPVQDSDRHCMNFRPVINFNDIESMIVPFDGSIIQNINTWIENFEDVSQLFNLSDLHKVVFAKRCMTGKAKLLIQSETGINTWENLKSLLISEFGAVSNSAELHELLSKRKLKEGESLDEYYLVMKQMGSRGNVEDSALITHIIHGITDSINKKSFLYGCQNLQEFRAKLKLYVKIRHDYDSARLPKPNIEIKKQPFKPAGKVEIKCYNCGGLNHKSINCNNKEKGPRCFRCSNFGHKSFECTKQKETKPRDTQSHVHTVTSQNLILKEVKLHSANLTALIDTGSQRTILKQSIYNKLKESSNLEPTNVTLTGLGNSAIKPVGHFKAEIEIDDSKFHTDVYVINDSSVCFDLIIGTDVIHQGTLTVSANGVKMSKIESDSQNFLVNVVNVLDEPDIELSHINDKELRSELSSLIKNYTPDKTKTVDVKMKIILTDEIPIFSSPRRLPASEKKIVEAQIDEWLKTGIIRRSSSEYSSPVVLVKKKNGATRLCVDYRRLNKKTVREHFPLPIIDDVIDQLHSAEVFTTIDLKNGFFHVEVEEGSRKYTSFVTHEGQYEFLKCSFGLTNSPSVFQKYIYNVFRDLLKDNTVVIYMDDLIIPSKNEAEGMEKLKLVLQTASEYGLELNLKKCNFLKREIDFLGYRIVDGKLHPSPLKTKAVINFPEPKCTKDVQSYLGLTGYFRKFIKNYSVIAKPLSDLLKKDAKFKFNNEEKNAFNQLKNILSSEPVLSIYNPKSETEIHSDASIDGYGAVLMQKSIIDNQFHPVYFASKKTTAAERKYTSYELEVLAVVEALKKFRVYVLGIPFKIVTDCNAFKMTMSKKDMCAKIARWALMLSDFDYSIEHRHGTSMRHVDALSRNPICMITQDSVTLKIIQAQETDEHIKAIKEILKVKSYDDYLIKGNVLYKCVNGTDLMVVPEEMQMNIIKTAHEKGHFAIKKTADSIENEFYIPKIKNKIEKCVSNCVPCILVNRKCGKQQGLLHPIEKEETPLHTYHVDHLGPLQSTHKNYKHIFAIIDAFTKFVWLYPTKSTDAAEVISKLEIQKTNFGSPFRIISDKGTAFTSKAFEEYCTQENIQHIQITTGLPRANGQVERLNSIIIAVLSKLSVDNPEKWYTHVCCVQQMINSTFQRSINTTPFELLFGTKMKLKSNVKITDLINSETQADFVQNRDELRKEAKKQILKVQSENRKTYNLRRRKANKFNVDDVVAIKRTQQGPGLKLKSKYLGPYKVVKVKFNDTYDVKKIGFTEGPMTTSTCAEYMKPWPDEN